MLQHYADRDALSAEKAKLLGMIVAGKITAAEAAARLREIKDLAIDNEMSAGRP